MTDAADTMTLETTKGPVVIKFRPDLAPNHVAHIKKLVSEGFYDGIVFHRVIEGFMAQTGCPRGTGTGGRSIQNLKAGVQQRAACARHLLDGPRASPDTANSQFFICFDDARFLNKQIYGLGRGDLRHGECRQDQARRAGERSGQDRQGDVGLID